MNIKLISREDAVDHWPWLSSKFAEAAAHGQGESTMVDYLQKILNFHAQCWVIIEEDGTWSGAGLTEILTYPQHKTLHIILFTGVDFEKQSKVLPIVEEFAKTNGCTALEAWGRGGWARMLPKHIPEFKEVYRVFRKPL